MYIVTFYSFKGGTGRSMALANVATELASRGKRVLMVDFDLEAPGLDTFPFTRPGRQQKGVVDFIQAYLASGYAPDIHDYVYETSPLGMEQASMWIMTAGCHDEAYDRRFRTIDWNDLYDNEQGFLLFEHLKACWKEVLQPDYVLIDSRTGHTDTGGICTRQLADAVVLFFVPNEQNRRGLKPVVEDIRSEKLGPLKKDIDLHFVMANVPDLQDEEEILATQGANFKKSLRYDDPCVVIHHYNSLSMLQQSLFVLDRPKSSLAREYRQLVETIVRGNIEDKQGAILLLDDALEGFRLARRPMSPKALEDRLRRIKACHPKDPDILRGLVLVRKMQRKNEEALALLDQLADAGAVDADTLLSRAELLAQLGKNDSALTSLSQLFLLRDAGDIDISLAVRLQLQLDRSGIAQLATSPMIEHIDADSLTDIADELGRVLAALPVSEYILKRWMRLYSDRATPDERDDVHLALVLCLIGLGHYQEAMLAISPDRPSPEALDEYKAFNYAMAEWGQLGIPPLDLLRRVIDINESRPDESLNKNYVQCISLVYWLVGEHDKAFACAKRAIALSEDAPSSSFSAWSYMTVSARQFKLEIEEMLSKFGDEQIVPEFIRRKGQHELPLLN